MEYVLLSTPYCVYFSYISRRFFDYAKSKETSSPTAVIIGLTEQRGRKSLFQVLEI